MNVLKNMANLFYVNTCTACAIELVQQEKIVCTACMATIAQTQFSNTDTNSIKSIFKGRVNIERAIAFYYYSKNSVIQKLLFDLKYKDKKEVATLLGTQAGLQLLQTTWIDEIDFIIPIPLSAKKEFLRGYNQSFLIAEAMNELIEKNLNTSLIKRIKNTETQTKKTRYERVVNLENAFELTTIKALENKHVLLVDDVITTGATFESCALEIKKKSPSTKISIASLCYAIDI
jgi:ComF family protein